MLINLDMTSTVPIYVQLRNEIVMGIGRGELVAGQGLPTVRQLAEDIGINTMTVNKAYNILRNEGYIEIDRRHGAKINTNLDMSQGFKEKMEQELELIIVESGLRGIGYEDFIKMCKEIFGNMEGLKVIEKEGW
ncbi:GntR family transcriptional regulator [Clostridium chauvoei]|uniref:GntR family transcriptional regulator n=2 Tax=Clostridium chauvoei TaxID=46867 RepID=A0ABD4RGJ3_9CLOT|nr:GntR family transcriptional regulator [Clostridium chauvoei]ATD55710.1 GntR family transcriptional regulator [Clostridium chauvoei]ATD56613.1 GntR family transcriptional regulator [Clostridium chauvoei]MBX7280254.1 GntR family transcriptional regulator [Clostridium chauvoei]MBX7282739.1 GntR family transcriptional regulator [Clostridium chauvoei]MBX7285145.1 GntR family transcriptional regulator [Clostridium chauvoei]